MGSQDMMTLSEYLLLMSSPIGLSSIGIGPIGPGLNGLGSSTVLLAEFDWVQFIIRTGITLAVVVVGLYLVMMVKDWMQTPQEYSTAGDDLESLREALKLGSIDEDEYRRAVQALKTMNERLVPKEVGDIKQDLVGERISAASFVEVKSEANAKDEERIND